MEFMELNGYSLIGGVPGSGTGGSFMSTAAASGKVLPPPYYCATPDEVNLAAVKAAEVFPVFSRLPGMRRAEFLRSAALNLARKAESIVARAKMETALSDGRLHSELSRTSNHLLIFAHQLEEGSWLQARIDTGDPMRKPHPKPDVRSLLRPIGPVVILGAGNFPLAFSVAGGDTASALAAGCPVIFKAHPAHPGTAEIIAQIFYKSLAELGLPPDIFSLLYDDRHEVAKALVQHPLLRGVAFTGSCEGGLAITQLAGDRPDPIPVFAQMSSPNPVFVLPGALQQKAVQISEAIAASIGLSAGQYCTKPSLVFLPEVPDGDALIAALVKIISAMTSMPMTSPQIAAQYRGQIMRRLSAMGVTQLNHQWNSAQDESSWVLPAILRTDAEHFIHQYQLHDEIFGPATLLVTYRDAAQIATVAECIGGQMGIGVFGTPEDFSQYIDLLGILEQRTGRLVFNGTPVRVELCNAMVHAGPFPATTIDRFSSVGSAAIHRFVRPVAYQDAPQAQLPDELKDENPLGILRVVNGAFTSAAVHTR